MSYIELLCDVLDVKMYKGNLHQDMADINLLFLTGREQAILLNKLIDIPLSEKMRQILRNKINFYLILYGQINSKTLVLLEECLIDLKDLYLQAYSNLETKSITISNFLHNSFYLKNIMITSLILTDKLLIEADLTYEAATILKEQNYGLSYFKKPTNALQMAYYINNLYYFMNLLELQHEAMEAPAKILYVKELTKSAILFLHNKHGSSILSALDHTIVPIDAKSCFLHNLEHLFFHEIIQITNETVTDDLFVINKLSPEAMKILRYIIFNDDSAIEQLFLQAKRKITSATRLNNYLHNLGIAYISNINMSYMNFTDVKTLINNPSLTRAAQIALLHIDKYI